MSTLLDMTTKDIESFGKDFASIIILMHGTVELIKLVKMQRECRPWEMQKQRAIKEAVDKVMKVMEPHRKITPTE